MNENQTRTRQAGPNPGCAGAERLRIDVFSDIACPFCFIGDARLERVLEARNTLEVDWHWHPFQLQPDLPERGVPWDEFSQKKFGGPQGRRAAFAQVVQNGVLEGIEFDFERMPVAPNTRDAHRLVLLASERGRGKAMARALYTAYFCAARDITDRVELERIALEVGLDSNHVRELFSGQAFLEDVQHSQLEAASLGISGVPFYIFDRRFALSGAQPAALFETAIERALDSDG